MLESSLAAYVSEIMQGILTLGPDWALSGPGLVILSDETPAAQYYYTYYLDGSGKKTRRSAPTAT